MPRSRDAVAAPASRALHGGGGNVFDVAAVMLCWSECVRSYVYEKKKSFERSMNWKRPTYRCSAISRCVGLRRLFTFDMTARIVLPLSPPLAPPPLPDGRIGNISELLMP